MQMEREKSWKVQICPCTLFFILLQPDSPPPLAVSPNLLGGGGLLPNLFS